MCQHFCWGGIIVIIVFTVVFIIAIFVSLSQQFNENSFSSESELRSYPPNSDYVINLNKTCELLLFSVTNDKVGDGRDKFVPDTNENFPLVVQLNYRTKDNNFTNLCSGVAVHTNYILTLAECVIDNNDRVLIGVTTNSFRNATDQNYKITDINVYDETMNHSMNVLHNIGLIRIENGFEITNQFCTRQLKDSGEILPSVWDGSSLKLATCSNRSQLPNRICLDRIRVASPGDPLIEYDNGVWYLIGLHQAFEFVPDKMSVYMNVHFYRNWISNIIESNKNT